MTMESGDGDTALFFGLSGTGKTTLSSDPLRRLIGDDEHGWSDSGVFNFEGGCYAKVIKLSAEAEPQIHATTRRFGTVLENVMLDPESRALDLDDASLTENTRASYPIGFIDNAELTGRGGHPIFNVDMPTTCPGVPDAVLDPRSTWADATHYDGEARALARTFVENSRRSKPMWWTR